MSAAITFAVVLAYAATSEDVVSAAYGQHPHLAGGSEAPGHPTANATSTHPVLTATTTEGLARQLEEMTAGEAATAMFEMDVSEAARVVEEMGTVKAADMMAKMDGKAASLIMGEMATKKAVAMLDVMEIDSAADIWSQVDKVKAGAIMEKVPTKKATEIVGLLPEERLVPRLPEISPGKLWEMPLTLLLRKLPSVPAMHLDFWNRPDVPPDLQDPVGKTISEAIDEYTLPQARAQEWALIVGSPAPFDRIWARFNRALSDVRIEVEGFEERPEGTPAFPAGRIANSFFRVSLANAEPGDVSVAAAIISVEQSWLTANQVHKWSIQFNQFNEGLGAWVPTQSKRIREDSQRVSFAVVVPGFSTLAITGSRELPPQPLVVTDLRISPRAPRAGEEFTIGATVANVGPQRGIYAANVWLNNSVQDAQDVVVEPGETVDFSFKLTKPEGLYAVRVERLLGDIVVSPASPYFPALPSVGGPALLVEALRTLVVLGSLLAAGGGYLLLRRRD